MQQVWIWPAGNIVTQVGLEPDTMALRRALARDQRAINMFKPARDFEWSCHFDMAGAQAFNAANSDIY